MLEVAGWLAGAVLVVLGIVLWGKRVESRSLSAMDYDRERSGKVALGNAMLATQALFEPGAKHAIEQRNAVETDDAEAAGPPDPGEEEAR